MKTIVIDVKDVVAEITKDAVFTGHFEGMTEQEALDTTAEEIIDVEENYEKYYTNNDMINLIISETQNFYNAVGVTIHPPTDIKALKEKNDISVIYLMDDSLPKFDKFESWFQQYVAEDLTLRHSILFKNSEPIDADYVISANPKVLNCFNCSSKMLYSTPYNQKASGDFMRISQWKHFLQYAKSNMKMDNVPRARFM